MLWAGFVSPIPARNHHAPILNRRHISPKELSILFTLIRLGSVHSQGSAFGLVRSIMTWYLLRGGWRDPCIYSLERKWVMCWGNNATLAGRWTRPSSESFPTLLTSEGGTRELQAVVTAFGFPVMVLAALFSVRFDRGGSFQLPVSHWLSQCLPCSSREG